MRLSCLLILLCALGCSKPSTSPKIYQDAIAKSDALIDSVFQAGSTPGIDALVAVDGEIVWAKAMGMADIEHQVPVRAGKTRFRVGSVSKSLAAAALGKLVDQGKVYLDSSVQTYVPYFPQKRYPITVKQIAGHIGGIRHYRGDEFLMNDRYATVRSSLAIFEDDTLLFEPGTQYRYSSYGFNLLSAVIEEASGQEFLSYMQQTVFSPLEMTFTTPDKNDSLIIDRTSFYVVNDDGGFQNAPAVDNSYKWAGGGFLSTTVDLMKFGQAQLSGFLSEGTHKEFITPQILANGEPTQYGVGWFAGEYEGYAHFGHSGGSVGGITQLRIFPDEGVIVVLLSNSSDTEYGDIHFKIAKLFIEAKG